jgi:hypothetical protein
MVYHPVAHKTTHIGFNEFSQCGLSNPFINFGSLIHLELFPFIYFPRKIIIGLNGHLMIVFMTLTTKHCNLRHIFHNSKLHLTFEPAAVSY